MAKTKILADLQKSLTAVEALGEQAMKEFATRSRSWRKTADELEKQTTLLRRQVTEVKKYMEKWDSPSLKSKLKNATKNKTQLTAARDAAKAQVAQVEIVVKSFEDAIRGFKDYRQKHEGIFLP